MIFLRLNKEKRKSPLAPGHQASAEATPGVRSWMSPGNAHENRDKLFHLRAEAKAGVRTHSSRMGAGGAHVGGRAGLPSGRKRNQKCELLREESKSQGWPKPGFPAWAAQGTQPLGSHGWAGGGAAPGGWGPGRSLWLQICGCESEPALRTQPRPGSQASSDKRGVVSPRGFMHGPSQQDQYCLKEQNWSLLRREEGGENPYFVHFNFSFEGETNSFHYILKLILFSS